MAYRNKHDIAKILTDQLTNPIKWVNSIEYLLNWDMAIFVEIGPGKVLSKLVERIAKVKDREVMILNTNTIEDIEKLKNSLRGEGIISEVKE